jgi:hypothetical protein
MLLTCTLFASDAQENNQRIYPVDSDVFEAITFLYISQGLSLPSTTGPWSEAELEHMLSFIEKDKLNESMVSAYEYAESILMKEPKVQSRGVDFSWNLDVNLEGYYHTNTDDFLGRDSWIRGFIEQKPVLSVGLETWPSDLFYGYSEFTIGNTYTIRGPNKDGLGFGSSSLTTNLILLPPADLMDLDFNMPYRAFVAGGGDYWTFQIGRDRLNWGAGETGNLMLSDNLKYHNMGRVTTFGEKYKYTFLTSFFPHASAYMDGTDSSDDPILGDGQFDEVSGLNLFMSHRLEWRMFQNTVGLAVTESIMYQSEDNTFDLRFLNPAAIFHDYYIRYNANSLLTIEVDYTPVRGLNVYVQAAVDEFSLPGEPVPSSSTKNYPPSFGYLGGIKGVFPVEDMVGHAGIEAAYTDPFLYLRDMDDDAGVYHLNYIGVIREFTNKVSTRYNASFLGYPYGGDAIVINLTGGLRRFGKWHVDLNGFYMIHGTHDIYTAWSKIGGDSDVPHDISTPTEEHHTDNYNDSDVSDRDSASGTLVIGANGSYQIAEGLKTFGQLDFIHINNFENASGQAAQDVQLTVGISYSL